MIDDVLGVDAAAFLCDSLAGPCTIAENLR